MFFVATAECAVIALDDQIATELDFPDTSIGYMVSAYAVDVIVGGPLLVATPEAQRAGSCSEGQEH
ncbi:hypothetical protein C5E08_15570 [Rathayibacter iranicus]|uniref:Uncharacterized protein n=2 Tax=Rathayibacter iranicus TaxID=59737 RepID=A0AAD1AFE6_9MICO|nr:hypothetical protein C7V51_15815 [Rathayibacter iranicus]PPI41198.1 hypothetical protein C5E09_14680 [Rathayibacter iranicus]PPI57444.1 hypothetical protein C5E08_15570 [Rathayibacter iranicus]PPI68309.1 hypothetical protein C5E01_14620 [Rathayibacter iranicus]PWJ66894.1 hypothetical protein B0H03_101350 [Rathayibacter iranicus NCPPB 2253 = VKM Ac-1602]